MKKKCKAHKAPQVYCNNYNNCKEYLEEIEDDRYYQYLEGHQQLNERLEDFI